MDSKTNIKLNYLYRDYSNYKQHGSVVFANPNKLSHQLIVEIISQNLIDGEFFNAEDWRVPSLFFEENTPDDHEWHEFVSIEETTDELTTGNIEILLNRILVS